VDVDDEVEGEELDRRLDQRPEFSNFARANVSSFASV
jgi:hypothetical protein